MCASIGRCRSRMACTWRGPESLRECGERLCARNAAGTPRPRVGSNRDLRPLPFRHGTPRRRSSMSRPWQAFQDHRLSARVVARAALRFAGGADDASDRPAHVRAGSGLARVPEGLVVIQDDSNFLALVDPARPTAVQAIPLPTGPDGRRQFGDSRANKHLKLDLEACVAVGAPRPLILGLGSGSTAARESIVLVRDWSGMRPDVRVVRGERLYASPRRAGSFSGSEMNIEGAVLMGGSLRLFG